MTLLLPVSPPCHTQKCLFCASYPYLWEHVGSTACWQGLSAEAETVRCLPFLLWNRMPIVFGPPYFPDSPESRYSQVTKFWPTKCKWKYCMGLAERLFQKEGISLPSFFSHSLIWPYRLAWMSMAGTLAAMLDHEVTNRWPCTWRWQSRDREVSLMALWSLHYQAWITHLCTSIWEKSLTHLSVQFLPQLLGRAHRSLNLKVCSRA